MTRMYLAGFLFEVIREVWSFNELNSPSIIRNFQRPAIFTYVSSFLKLMKQANCPGDLPFLNLNLKGLTLQIAIFLFLEAFLSKSTLDC